MLSITFVFLVNLSLSVYRLSLAYRLLYALGSKALHQELERGKELSLSVKEQSSPESRSPQADTDGPQPVIFWRPWVGPKFGSHR